MGAHKGYDFSGWATRFNLKCSDGRTIRDSAFRECDGKTVPMVWQHMHDSPANVLGHCVLEYRPNEGMYAYGYCNDTEMGQQAKQLVANGDITAYSIYANKLKQKGGDVLHGVIREVSLVLSGANPGACIDMPTLEHSDEETETEAYIYNDDASVFLSGKFFAGDCFGLLEQNPVGANVCHYWFNCASDGDVLQGCQIIWLFLRPFLK